MKRRPTSIVKYPAKVLSTKAEEIFFSKEYFDEQFRKFRLANHLNGGVAVAAPQMGISSRFFFYDYEGEVFMAINPVLNELSEETVVAEEGCLSLPGKSFQIERSVKVNWTFMDGDGETHTEDVEGWKARIIQHECDHLDGICISDKLP